MSEVDDEKAGTTDAEAREVIARPDFWHRLQRCIAIPLICLGAGGWFLYDGAVRWPNENRVYGDLSTKIEIAKAKNDPKAESEAFEARKSFKHHDELDLNLQLLLGFFCIPLGLAAAYYFNSKARGRFRLADNVLEAPGHPPISIDSITEVDKTKWDRKGIAYLKYELPAANGGRSAAGRITLDDALYQQEPMQRILKVIEKKLLGDLPTEDPAETDAGASKSAE